MRDKSRRKCGYWKFCSIRQRKSWAIGSEETPYAHVYLPHLPEWQDIESLVLLPARLSREFTPCSITYRESRGARRYAALSASLKLLLVVYCAPILCSSPEISHLISEGAAPLATRLYRIAPFHLRYPFLKIVFSDAMASFGFLRPSSDDRMYQFSTTKERR